MLSPRRLRRTGPASPPLEQRPNDEVVHRAPEQRDRHDRELGEQRLAVAGRPQLVDAGEPLEDRYVPARTSTATSTVAMREKPRNASRRRSGCERPDARRERDEASDPEHRGDEVEPVGEAGEEGRVRLHALVPREREPGREPDPDQKGRPQEARTVEDPGEEHQCRHERVPERHRDERDAETSLRRDRREVAVEEVDERDLQGVGGTHHERGDADVEHGDATDGRDPVEPVRKPRRQRLAEHEQPETDRPDDERERDEERPAGGVVRPVRPRRAVGLGRRRRRHADAERVDAGARVAVRRRRPPADRVCLAPLQAGERRADDPSVGRR